MKRYLLLMLLISCTQEIQVVETVEKEIFKELIQDNYLILDVRTPGEFMGGHIEHALNIDFNGPDFKNQISKLDKDQPLLIYCAVGGRSAKAALLMESLGFKKVYELKGGYRNW